MPSVATHHRGSRDFDVWISTDPPRDATSHPRDTRFVVEAIPQVIASQVTPEQEIRSVGGYIYSMFNAGNAKPQPMTHDEVKRFCAGDRAMWRHEAAILRPSNFDAVSMYKTHAYWEHGKHGHDEPIGYIKHIDVAAPFLRADFALNETRGANEARAAAREGRLGWSIHYAGRIKDGYVVAARYIETSGTRTPEFPGEIGYVTGSSTEVSSKKPRGRVDVILDRLQAAEEEEEEEERKKSEVARTEAATIYEPPTRITSRPASTLPASATPPAPMAASTAAADIDLNAPANLTINEIAALVNARVNAGIKTHTARMSAATAKDTTKKLTKRVDKIDENGPYRHTKKSIMKLISKGDPQSLKMARSFLKDIPAATAAAPDEKKKGKRESDTPAPTPVKKAAPAPAPASAQPSQRVVNITNMLSALDDAAAPADEGEAVVEASAGGLTEETPYHMVMGHRIPAAHRAALVQLSKQRIAANGNPYQYGDAESPPNYLMAPRERYGGSFTPDGKRSHISTFSGAEALTTGSFQRR